MSMNGKRLCQRSTNLLFLIVRKASNTHKQHHVLNFPITQNRQSILLSDKITQNPLYALPQNADLQLNVTEALAWQCCRLPKYPPGHMQLVVPHKTQAIQFHRTFRNGFISRISLYFLPKLIAFLRFHSFKHSRHNLHANSLPIINLHPPQMKLTEDFKCTFGLLTTNIFRKERLQLTKASFLTKAKLISRSLNFSDSISREEWEMMGEECVKC